MHWTHLNSESQLTDVLAISHDKTIVIFKHSHRCVVSSMVLNRVEKIEQTNDVDFYFIDVITHRSISQKLAEILQVHHESPQVLLIKSGECVFTESHNGITCDEVLEQIALLRQEIIH